ncbi:MAG: alanine:cation symporter family protein [Bdellovibrionales bacterium]|nr:alanine:cation symporter family protein [Bdellovibrionales bacterium]
MEDFINLINSYLFSDVTVFALLFAAVGCTLWTRFGQYYALGHGVSVIRGVYDRSDDPGAISHFQALSAALSATVGLGNIGGVAVAIALGGPGAVFWMWMIGLFGMALKMTEVTQAMLSRRFDKEGNPHGGPMYVVEDGFTEWGLPKVGRFFGCMFCVAAVVGAITGGNMFQAWNVAAVTNQYFSSIPREAVGVILAMTVAVVVIGGIQRIGAVAGRLVPFMCGIYLISGFYVLAVSMDQLPGILVMIFRSGLGLEDSSAGGAFLGASLGTAFIWGVKRALFSSESGWGSAPIAHSAARTDEPVREGIVAGLEPFIDTLLVCTVTALVILCSGAWNRTAEASFVSLSEVSITAAEAESGKWQLVTPILPSKSEESKRIQQIPVDQSGWQDGESVFVIAEDSDGRLFRVQGTVSLHQDSTYTATWETFEGKEPKIHAPGIFVNFAGASLTAHAFDRVIPGLGLWLVVLASWLFAVSTMISWYYYGEQAVYYVVSQGSLAKVFLFLYKLAYCALAFVATMPFIRTDRELDMWTTLGMGCMLVMNIPIVIVFGSKAMREYHQYIRKLKAGEFRKFKPQAVVDMVEGKLPEN